MGFHVHLRGALEYPSAADALAAHQRLVESGDFILTDGARVDGNRLLMSFKNFAGDPSDAVEALVDAAKSAVSGKILYDDEAGERMQIPATAVGIGHTPAANEFVQKLRLEGAWTFASDEEAQDALEVLAAALVRHPPRALTTKRAVLTLRFEGRAPSITVFAVKRALFAIAPRAVSGTIRHHDLGDVTVLEAPLRALDDGDGERRFIRYAGAFKYRNERARDNALAAGGMLGATAKGKQKIIVVEQGTIAVTRLDAIHSTFAALVAAAVDGKVRIDTADGFDVLEAPERA